MKTNNNLPTQICRLSQQTNCQHRNSETTKNFFTKLQNNKNIPLALYNIQQKKFIRKSKTNFYELYHANGCTFENEENINIEHYKCFSYWISFKLLNPEKHPQIIDFHENERNFFSPNHFPVFCCSHTKYSCIKQRIIGGESKLVLRGLWSLSFLGKIGFSRKCGTFSGTHWTIQWRFFESEDIIGKEIIIFKKMSWLSKSYKERNSWELWNFTLNIWLLKFLIFRMSFHIGFALYYFLSKNFFSVGVKNQNF